MTSSACSKRGSFGCRGRSSWRDDRRAGILCCLLLTYRACATVNVDFNLEQAWPQETDRQQFYYLERETRKLEEIALSDDVMQSLASSSSVSVEELRNGKLTLGQLTWGGMAFRRRG